MAGNVRIIGLEATLAKLDSGRIAGRPARNFMNRWALSVEGGGKKRAPVWRGQLRRSITHEIEGSPIPKYARVGTNVPYAAAMEHGTGLLSDEGSGKRHWPPGAALNAWASAHGMMSGYQVAAAIGKRGGLKPRRYLRDAADAAAPNVPGWLSQMARDIEAQADAGSGA